MFTLPGKGLSGWTPNRSQPRSRRCFLLHICSRRVWWERPVYHRGVPSPLARSARSASGRRARCWRPAGVTPAHGSPRCTALHQHLLLAGRRQKIARIRSAPANSIQGGRVPTGKNRWDGEIVTGGVMLPLKTGAAGLASCPSCPLTTTGGRDRRLPPSVLSSQPPRPPSLNSLWVQLTVATAPPVAAREPLGAVADPVWHSAVRTRVARRSMRRSHGSRSPHRYLAIHPLDAEAEIAAREHHRLRHRRSIVESALQPTHPHPAVVMPPRQRRRQALYA